MNKQAFYNGFIKRAQQYGVAEQAAQKLFKTANIHELMDFGKDWWHGSADRAKDMWHGAANNIHGSQKAIGELITPNPSHDDMDRLDGSINDHGVLSNMWGERGHNLGTHPGAWVDELDKGANKGGIDGMIGAASGGVGGAALGGGIGALTSKQHRGRNAAIGAGIGGALGGIGGAGLGGVQAGGDAGYKMHESVYNDLETDTLKRHAKELMTPEGTKELRQALMRHMQGKF